MQSDKFSHLVLGGKGFDQKKSFTTFIVTASNLLSLCSEVLEIYYAPSRAMHCITSCRDAHIWPITLHSQRSLGAHATPQRAFL